MSRIVNNDQKYLFFVFPPSKQLSDKAILGYPCSPMYCTEPLFIFSVHKASFVTLLFDYLSLLGRIQNETIEFGRSVISLAGKKTATYACWWLTLVQLS